MDETANNPIEPQDQVKRQGRFKKGHSGNPGGRPKAGREHHARIKTERLKKAFLSAFAKHGNVTQAAIDVGMTRTQHYLWMADVAYREAFKAAEDQATDALEKEARRRAEEGVRRIKTHNGQVIMVPSDLNDPTSEKIPLIEHEYSDTLLIFLLKGLRPAKYRERHEVVGAEGGAIQIQSKQEFDWDAYRAAKANRDGAGRISAAENGN